MKGSHCRFKIQISLIYYFNFQPSSDMAAFRADFAKAKHIVVLTGAGVSAESGVPTFRGAGGFWRKWQAQVCVVFIVVIISYFDQSCILCHQNLTLTWVKVFRINP